MPTPLKVLIVEDRRTDAELMVYELRRAGYDVSWSCVITDDEFIARLAPDLDVILADYSLPEFDALRALERLCESGLDVPLLIVSGTIGEETAVAAMKRGASDYILKDRMLRLGTAVSEALDKRRLRRERETTFKLLRDSEERFRRMIENSTDGILMVGPKGDIEYATPAAGRILQLPAGTLVGRTIFDFICLDEAIGAARRFRELVQGLDMCVVGQLRCRRNDGLECWIEATARNLLHEPTVQAVVVNFRNVTARVTGERKLLEYTQELKAKNQLLDRNARRLEELNAAAHQVVENVSHDFRTPLTVLAEFCSLMRDGHGGPITDQQTEFLEIMATRIEDLSLMVENLLDVSAHEAGITPMFRCSCDLNFIIERLRTLLERRAAGKKTQLEFVIPEGLPAIYCDEEQIRRVIMNLAVNAIKFTDPGGRVQIWSRYRPGTADVTIGVTDNGPGISRDNLRILFDRFRQAAHTSTTKGFGLGLSIAKQFAQQNLGTIGVQSEVGTGSTFWFHVPMAEPLTVFSRYLNLLKMDTDDSKQVSLLVVGAGQRHISDVIHLLKLKLHSTDLAYPCHPESWCVAVSACESELPGFVEGLQAEWRKLRKNSLVREMVDLSVVSLGTWDLRRDESRLVSRFRETIRGEKAPREQEPHFESGPRCAAPNSVAGVGVCDWR